jgi:hypothetical protein
MKSKYLSRIPAPVLLLTSLMSINSAAISAPITFSTLPTTVISETSGPFNDSINYTPINSPPDILNSATLKIYLSDDVSSTFPGSVIDAPREWASLTSVTDGTMALASLPADEEVDPQLFDPSEHGVVLSGVAADAGIENPSVLPSTSPYFNIDVTDLIKDSNSGTLDFSLEALDLYSEISRETSPGVLNPIYALIFADALLVDPDLVLPDTIPVFEDFLFSRAELELDVTAVPIPAAIWLFGSSIFSLLVIRRKKA